MNHHDEQSDLIAALFSAVSEGDAGAGWIGFLDRLAAVVQADGTALTLDVGTGGRHGWVPGLDPDTLRQMRLGRVYDHDTLPGTAPEGVLRAVKVRFGRAGYAVLRIHRAAFTRDFRSADALHLDGLVPFLGQAIDGWHRLEHAREAHALSEQVAAGLGAGWIVFDRIGTVLDLSPAVLDWSERASLRLVERRRLEPDDPEVAQRLRRGLAACAGGAGPVNVTLQNAPLVELRLNAATWQGGPAIVGLFRCAPMAGALSTDRIAAHLNLNRSEARLVALLCDGETLRSAAGRLGWTEETARSASKQVYARLGVSGQTGLLRHVLGGALWLA